MAKQWTPDEILEMARAFQPACVLAAAADLELFDYLVERPLRAADLAEKLGADRRGVAVLLDALAAIGLLVKDRDRYALPPDGTSILTTRGQRSVAAMMQHQANCLRRWAEIARTVKSGRPAERAPSIRGEEADEAAFIGAMDNISAPIAGPLVAEVGPPTFRHLLDLGGASGTWTIAFLRSRPDATATIFDLPHVIPMAERRIRSAELSDRVFFVAGDFERDELPTGADLAWVSAIIHQNSREQNRRLFGSIFHALTAGGQILIRDMIMEESRTQPVGGALFAVNMLVATESGGTYTFNEIAEDLQSVGFVEARILRRTEAMDSVVGARKLR